MGDPRAEWDGAEADESYRTEIGPMEVGWADGANDRLAALLPQLEAADALAEALADTLSDERPGRVPVRSYLDAYLAARDAHLTEGE